MTSKPSTQTELDGPTRHIRLPIAYGLLLLSALPDAMVVPVLRQLIVVRYDVHEGDAHKFMYVNLLGAMVAVVMLARFRARFRLRTTIAVSAAMNAAMLAIMSFPIGFAPTLIVRFVEGGFDLVVYAMLFDVIAQTGSDGTRGRRMGAAATFMLIGLASGIAIGGRIGHDHATSVLTAGAAACTAVSILSMFCISAQVRGRLERGNQLAEIARSGALIQRPLWPALGMMFSDRALAGLLATTVSLFLSSASIGLPEKTIGGLIGLAMLMIALGAWPAGRVIDAVGCLRIRLVAGIVYALGLGTIPFVAHGNVFVLAGIFAMIGLGGAALFASSLVVVCRSRLGPAGMAAYHTAGNFGFMVGPMIAGAILGSSNSVEHAFELYTAVLIGFAGFHFLTNIAMTLGATASITRKEGDVPASPMMRTGSGAASTLRK